MIGIEGVLLNEQKKQEYWINVYDQPLWPTHKNPKQGALCIDKEQAEHVTMIMLKQDYKTLYRIHVRLK